MADSPTTQTETERLAALIAARIFYHNSDHDMQLQLKELLIQFADEIKRRAIEP